VSRVTLAVLTLVASLTLRFDARADEPTETGASFDRGAKALVGGRYEDAIAELEAYADREAPHPDASFDRGMAYLVRVRSGAERPGDLGRAAAAFEEARLLRPDDDEARHALELVRAEIARRRARSGKGVVLATPSIDRALVGIAEPRTWSLVAIGAGLLLGLGVWLRGRRGTSELAGLIVAGVSGVAVAALVPLALWSSHLERERRPGVLVVRDAFLTDDSGTTLGGDPVVEGARLELAESRGDRVLVRYGAREGWLPIEAARELRRR
jgi:hypothetical protein